jgi:hypothetical protein
MRALALSALALSVANNLRETCVTPVKASLLLMVMVPLGGVVSAGMVVVVVRTVEVVEGGTVEVTGMLVVMGTEVVTRMLVVAGIEVVKATELVVEGIIVVVVVEGVEEEVELELEVVMLLVVDVVGSA